MTTQPTWAPVDDDTADLDETYRLALMALGPSAGVMAVARVVREVHPDASAANLGRLHAKYVGFDGRFMATHDYVTGERK